MDLNKYRTARIIIAIFIAMTVSMAVTLNNIYLAFAAVFIGMISMIILRKKTKGIESDERVILVNDKAARLAYGIITPLMALASFVLMMIGRRGYPDLELLGSVLSYITLFNIWVYSIAYYFLFRKYGGMGDEQ